MFYVFIVIIPLTIDKKRRYFPELFLEINVDIVMSFVTNSPRQN